MSAIVERWRASRALRGGTLVAIAALAVAVTWYPSSPPAAGFDSSWQIALHLIAANGLDFGHDVVFTYGPLGFTLFPQVVTGPTWAVAFVVTLALRIGLVFVVIGATRRATGNLGAGAIAGYVCAAALGPLVTIPGLLSALVALVIIQQPLRPARRRWLVPVLLGAFAAMCLLIKLDGGVLALLVLGTAAWFQGARRWIGLGQFTVGYVVAFVLGWVATGNHLSDIPRWLAWSRQMVGGYTGGAAFTDERVGGTWHFTVVFAAIALLGVGAWWAWRVRPCGERIALPAVVALTCWMEFKHGFVRHDTHVAGTLLAVGLLPLTLRFRTRPFGWAAFACAAVGVIGSLNAMDIVAGDRLRPAGARGLAHEARMLVDGARRNRAIATAKATARRVLAVDPSVLDAIGETPVHVAPQETSAVWAYDLAWRPLPQFQSFSTWTPVLDRLNAERLSQSSGPQMILRQSIARLDRHNPVFESPQENMELICHFRQRRFVGRWEVLLRTGQRCGRERALGTATADGNGEIHVPRGADDELVYARISISPSLWSRLRSVVYRPAALPEISLPDGPSLQPYRIPAALLVGPLLLRMPGDVVVPPRLRQVLGIGRMRLAYIPGARVRFFARTVTP